MLRTGFAIGCVLLVAVSGWGQNMISARPGLVNYTEGDVQIDGQPVKPKTNGTKLLGRGQVLDTTTGKAEVLLTPGVFLRIGDHSAIKMVSPELTDTQVQLQRGSALVEVTELFKGNHVEILDGDATTTLLKQGLYQFDADQPSVRVYDGKVQVREDDRKAEAGKGREVLLAGNLKTEKFDRKEETKTDPLYRWSEVRSGFLSEANVASARTAAASSGFWAGPGWYWNPWFSAYSFIPGDGILYSPFGFGFYSPGWVGYAPIYAYRPYPLYGGGVIAGRPIPPPRVIRPAIPVRGVTTSGTRSFGGGPRAVTAGSGSVTSAPSGMGRATSGGVGRTSSGGGRGR